MSLEAKIEALTKAVEENTNVQNEILKKLAGSAASTSSGKGSTSTSSGKGSTTSSKGKAKDAPSEAVIRTAFGDWLAEKGISADEKNTRREMTKKIAEHFDVDRVTSIKEDSRQEALDILEKIKDGEFPEWLQEEEADNSDLV